MKEVDVNKFKEFAEKAGIKFELPVDRQFVFGLITSYLKGLTVDDYLKNWKQIVADVRSIVCHCGWSIEEDYPRIENSDNTGHQYMFKLGEMVVDESVVEVVNHAIDETRHLNLGDLVYQISVDLGKN